MCEGKLCASLVVGLRPDMDAAEAPPVRSRGAGDGPSWPPRLVAGRSRPGKPKAAIDVHRLRCEVDVVCLRSLGVCAVFWLDEPTVRWIRHDDARMVRAGSWRIVKPTLANPHVEPGQTSRSMCSTEVDARTGR